MERLPLDSLDWRPTRKIVYGRWDGIAHRSNARSWADSIFNLDELDVDLATYKPYQATSAADLLKTFDDKVASCEQVLEGVDEETIMQPWRLKMMGQLMFEKPRADVFRDFTLSHLIHHRGQFSVYLRLLNVPVPGSYGPSADEQAQ